MSEKEINIVKHVSLTKVKAPFELMALKNNSNFCGSLIKGSGMTQLVNEFESENETHRPLVYDVSKAYLGDSDALARITELLLQLRAAQSDQSIFVQNNTVLREQILSQLKNEILRVNNRLSKNQIKNLEVISNNNFDEKQLAEILKSILQSSKKKSGESGKSIALNMQGAGASGVSIFDRFFKNYSTIVENSIRSTELVNRIFKNVSYRNEFFDTKLKSKVHLENKKGNLISSPKRVYSDNTLKEVSQIQATESSEFTRSYEENVLRKISIFTPKVKYEKKASVIDFLTNISKFVEKISSKPLLLENFSKRHFSKIKNVKENITDTKLTEKDTFETKFVNRTMHINSSEFQQENFVNKDNFESYQYVLTKKLGDVVRENNLILNKFKTKEIKHSDVFKKSTIKNENLLERELHEDNYSQIQKFDREKLFYRKKIETHSDVQNLAPQQIVNEVIENKYKKDFVKVRERIQKVINLLTHKNIHEVFEIKDRKLKGETEFLDKVFLQHSTGGTVPTDKSLKKFDEIYKFTPVYKYENDLKEEKIQNLFFKKISSVLDPKTVRRLSFKFTEENIYKKFASSAVDKYIFDNQKIEKNLKLNGKKVYREFMGKVSPSFEYMIYKENKPMVIKEESKEKSKKSDDKHNLKEKLKTKEKSQMQKSQKVDFSKIEKSILDKVLKKSDVEKMIETYLEDINIESISERVMSSFEERFDTNNCRSGVF